MKKLLIAALALAALSTSASSQSVTNKDIVNAVVAPTRAEAITPNDGANLPHNTTGGIWCSTTGTLKVDMVNGGTVTLTGVPAGTMVRIAAKRVYSTGTTVTGLVAFF